LKSSTWQGKAIRGMIRILIVSCATILVCSKDDGKTMAQTTFNDMVIGVVLALYELSLLVSQQNHLDLALNTLDDALK
jgi:hypothetical protein